MLVRWRDCLKRGTMRANIHPSCMQKPDLSFWQIWNMSFGFLGIQFGWGLQMANMSSIYGYLGADPATLPMLWLAAPLTGVIIQPLIGQASDRLWTPLGRRRPFILGGALLASAALVWMPNAPSLWVAAGLLWVLDGTINASMQPFRALVADNLPDHQSAQGFAIQSLFIGLGGSVASALPWMMIHWFGVKSEGAGAGHIPASVRLSFYIGAGAYLTAVSWTVLRTREYPPEPGDVTQMRRQGFDWTLGLGEIIPLFTRLPRRMWELGLVQFFTWIGMFALWVYFPPAIARSVYHAAPGTVAMEAAGSWSGFCFAVYNLVCFGFSFVLLRITRVAGPRMVHAGCLMAGAAGLALTPMSSQPYQLLFSMVAVGVAWSSILSMPYALLAPALPPGRVGVMMGLFNLFIVFPQIMQSALLGFVLKHFLNNNPMNALVLGGGSMALAGLLTLWLVGNEAGLNKAVPRAVAAH